MKIPQHFSVFLPPSPSLHLSGVLPVQVEDVAIPLSPPSHPAPTVPPRSRQDSQDRECTPPPALPPPLALTDIPDLPPHRGHHRSPAMPPQLTIRDLTTPTTHHFHPLLPSSQFSLFSPLTLFSQFSHSPLS